MITLNPAIQLGIDDKVGTLEEGKHGDVSIWSEHPLSIYSVNQKTFVDGVKYFDKEEDPSDMRIDINPSESYSQTLKSNSSDREVDSCMHDVFYLFSESNTQ